MEILRTNRVNVFEHEPGLRVDDRQQSPVLQITYFQIRELNKIQQNLYGTISSRITFQRSTNIFQATAPCRTTS